MNNDVISFDKMQKILWKKFEDVNNEFNNSGVFWWAHSGTLLGLVREKGIIPWDDDIDMGMSYKEFINKQDLIKKIANKFRMNLINTVNERTGESISFLETKKSYNISFNGDVYEWKLKIEIMLAIPEYKFSRLKLIPWHIVLQKWYWKYYVNNKNVIVKIGQKPIQINRFVGFFWNIGYWFTPTNLTYSFIRRKYNKLLKYNNNWSKVQFWFSSVKGSKNVFDLNSMSKLKVNDSEFNVSFDYKKELDNWYGSSWKEKPPIDQRKPQHFIRYKK